MSAPTSRSSRLLPGARTGDRPATARLAGAALAAGAVLLTGCSQGSSDFNGNQPDPSPSVGEAVRTPSPVGTDLPYTDPPLGNTLPGPTGAAPGDVPTTAAPASPGEGGGADSDGGSTH